MWNVQSSQPAYIVCATDDVPINWIVKIISTIDCAVMKVYLERRPFLCGPFTHLSFNYSLVSVATHSGGRFPIGTQAMGTYTWPAAVPLGSRDTDRECANVIGLLHVHFASSWLVMNSFGWLLLEGWFINVGWAVGLPSLPPHTDWMTDYWPHWSSSSRSSTRSS